MSVNTTPIDNLYKKIPKDSKLSFDIEHSSDSFYSEQNMTQLHKSAQQVKKGKIITKTM